jgi:mRNA-degrading endonuclease RelE of RelBE toxin-antitoxin system
MYKIELIKTAKKVYLKLPEKTQRLIFEKLLKLAESPFSPQHDVKQLQGVKDSYRLRVGD